LGTKQRGWHYPSAKWVLEAERLVELDHKLAAILKDQGQPANAAERLALARFCQQHKKLPRAAAGLYAGAFAAEPKLADDLPARYNAACSAALAAAGRGEDAAQLGDGERARWRQQALDWLHADLGAWAKVLESAKPGAHSTVRQKLQHWQRDSNLTGVRGAAALAKLPEEERAGWQKLWDDVADLLKRAEMGGKE
jgi:serine/threonine-protein kinase